MTEIFKPRGNMKYIHHRWECRDQNNNLICDGGPSVIWSKNGTAWMFKDHDRGLHRLDGPATSDKVWWFNNKPITEEIHSFAKENSIDLKNLTEEDKVLIALKFG